MSKIDDGGAAFPTHDADPGTDPRSQILTGGMSLRDWLAGQALTGILAGGFAGTIPHDDVNGGGDAAFFAYQYADAMLAARSKGEA